MSTPLEMSERAPPVRGAWARCLVNPFESAFSLLQKYAWANCVGAQTMGRELFGRARVPSESWTSSCDLLLADWIEEPRLRLPTGLPVMRGLLSPYGSCWPRALASDGTFRFCVPCLREGFHSIFFQVEALEHCPIHNAPLETRCPHCARYPLSIRLYGKAFRAPFSCDFCERTLVEPLNPQRWVTSAPRKEHIASALLPIAKWLRALRAYPIPKGYEETPLAQLRASPPFNDRDGTVIFHIARALVPLELPTSTYRKLRRPLRFRYLSTRARPPTLPAQAARAVPRYPILKSIRRHLLRTQLRGHHRCLRGAYHGTWVAEIKGTADLVQRADLCPVAAAFERWRIYQWSPPRPQRMEEWRSNPRLWGALDDLEKSDASDADEVLWAHEVLAEFYRCAATVYELERTTPRQQIGEPFYQPVPAANPAVSEFFPGEACWVLPAGRAMNDRRRHLLAFGDGRIIAALEAIGHTKAYPRLRSFNQPAEEMGECERAPRRHRSRKVRWGPYWALPYESALSVLLKYSRNNHLGKHSWRQWVFTLKSARSEQSLLSGANLRSPPRLAPEHAVSEGTLNRYAPRWRCALTLETRFRFCATCLEAEYHSVFYQIAEIKRCPIHEPELQTDCPACGRDPQLLYEITRLEPLRCAHCGVVLFGLDPAPGVYIRTRQLQQLRDRFGRLAQWLARGERPDRTGVLDRMRAPIAELFEPLPEWLREARTRERELAEARGKDVSR